MQIYVASLADYVAGRLHGRWIDLEEHTTADEIAEQIQQILDTSPEPIAEEWAIHDYDEFPNLGEYVQLETLEQVAAGIAAHGDAYRAWCEDQHYTTTDPRTFEDQYIGEYESEADYAREMFESTSTSADDNPLYPYVDWEAYGRDYCMDLTDLPAPNGNIYLFDYSA